MASHLSRAVTNWDGIVLRKDAVFFIAKLDHLNYDDYRHSRLYGCVNGDWGHRDIDFQASSLMAIHYINMQPPYKIFSLGLISRAVDIS